MSAPAWSVVVPTYNRPRALRRAVEALAELSPPPGGYEVIVVDDGTRASLDFIHTSDTLRLHRQANSGPAAARNAGLALARGARIAFTDDDCQPAADWLLHFDRALDDTPEALLGGRTQNRLTRNAFSAASQDLIDFLYRAEREPTFFASNNIAGSTDEFRRLGGFDSAYPLAAGEDRALCRAWVADGRRLRFVPEARVSHFHNLDWTSYWRQHERYGRGAFRFLVLGSDQSPDKAGRTPRIAPLSFYARLITQPFRSESRNARYRRMALLMLAQAATAEGFLRELHGRALGDRST